MRWDRTRHFKNIMFKNVFFNLINLFGNRNFNKRLLYFTMVLLLSISGYGHAISEQQIRNIIEKIEKTRVNQNIPGLSVAIVKNNTPIITRGFGVSNLSTQSPVDENTQFRIASISKTFVTLSVLKMVEQGKLKLTDSIYQYLPDYSPKTLPHIKNDIQVIDLLVHQSAISSAWYAGDEPVFNAIEALENLPIHMSQDYLVWDRNTVHAYNNAAYALAGLIVSRIAGQPWDEFLENEFFIPLNMPNTLSHLPNNVSLPLLSQSYSKGQLELLYNTALMPAGGIISTAADMSNYMQAILDSWIYNSHAIVGRELIQGLSKKQYGPSKYDQTFSTGLGVYKDNINGHASLSHNGSFQGFESEMILIPSQNLGIFVSANARESAEVVYELSQALARELTEPKLDRDTQISGNQNTDQDVNLTLSSGQYVSDGLNDDISLLEVLNSNQLELTLSPDMTLLMSRVNARRFKSAGPFPLEIEIFDDESGFKIYVFGQVTPPVYSKIQKTILTPEIEQKLGYYQLQGNHVEFGDIIIGYQPDEQLLYVSPASGEFRRPLKVLSDSHLQVQGYGRGFGAIYAFSPNGQLNAMGYQFSQLSEILSTRR